jgi:hypothetical protein
LGTRPTPTFKKKVYVSYRTLKLAIFSAQVASAVEAKRARERPYAWLPAKYFETEFKREWGKEYSALAGKRNKED